jgi:hypothetical protein
MEKVVERNLETVFLEHLEKLTKTNFSEDTKQKLASRFNISYHQYGDLIVPIDLKRFKMFKKGLISNVDLKVTEKVSSYILYIPVISLQYVSLSSFQLWKKIEPGNNFLNINEVYRIEGVYSFLMNLYKYGGRTGNKLNNERLISRINVSKYDFNKYENLLILLLLSSISNYAYPSNIFYDIGYASFLGDKFSGFTGFSIYFAKIKLNKIYERFDENGYKKIKIFNKDLLANGGKVYKAEGDIYGSYGQVNVIQSSDIYLSWRMYDNLSKKELEDSFYALVLRIYEVGSKILMYDIIIGELKEILPAISFAGLELDKFLSNIESNELYLLLSTLIDIKNKINKVDDKIPGSHIFGTLVQRYDYQRLSPCVKEFVRAISKEDNINVYQISTFLHSKLLDNLKDKTNIERQQRIDKYLYLSRYVRNKLTKT